METIYPPLSHVSTWWTSLTGPALEALHLALSSLSPVEAAALTLGWVGFVVAVARWPRPVVPLNVRLASEADKARQVTR